MLQLHQDLLTMVRIDYQNCQICRGIDGTCYTPLYSATTDSIYVEVEYWLECTGDLQLQQELKVLDVANFIRRGEDFEAECLYVFRSDLDATLRCGFYQLAAKLRQEEISFELPDDARPCLELCQYRFLAMSSERRKELPKRLTEKKFAEDVMKEGGELWLSTDNRQYVCLRIVGLDSESHAGENCLATGPMPDREFIITDDLTIPY